MVTTMNAHVSASPKEKSLQLAVLQIVLIVLTLSLWKGWAEENKELERQIARVDAMTGTPASAYEATQVPSLLSVGAQREEQEFRYHERAAGQPWKLIPLLLSTAACGFFLCSKKAQAKSEEILRGVVMSRTTEMSARVRAVCIGAIAIVPTWMIDGHAQTGWFCGVVVAGYVYWLLRPRKAALASGVGSQETKSGLKEKPAA